MEDSRGFPSSSQFFTLGPIPAARNHSWSPADAQPAPDPTAAHSRLPARPRVSSFLQAWCRFVVRVSLIGSLCWFSHRVLCEVVWVVAAMECMRAMSTVYTGTTSLAITRSDIARGESVSFRGRVVAVGSLRVPRGLRAFPLRRSVGVRASVSGADEPLDYKAEKAANEAGREFEEAKQSVGSSAEDLKEKASGDVDEGKQSLSSTMEDLKRRAGETKSHAEGTASKVCVDAPLLVSFLTLSGPSIVETYPYGTHCTSCRVFSCLRSCVELERLMCFWGSNLQ